jgi:hypothetical protein
VKHKIKPATAFHLGEERYEAIYQAAKWLANIERDSPGSIFLMIDARSKFMRAVNEAVVASVDFVLEDDNDGDET